MKFTRASVASLFLVAVLSTGMDKCSTNVLCNTASRTDQNIKLFDTLIGTDEQPSTQPITEDLCWNLIGRETSLAMTFAFVNQCASHGTPKFDGRVIVHCSDLPAEDVPLMRKIYSPLFEILSTLNDSCRSGVGDQFNPFTVVRVGAPFSVDEQARLRQLKAQLMKPFARLKSKYGCQ